MKRTTTVTTINTEREEGPNMWRGSRKHLMAGFGMVGALLMLGSAASACAVFKGKMVVAGKGTSVVTAIGTDNSSMAWCPGYPLGKAKAARGGTVTITVSKNPSDSCDPGVRLAAGDYQVNYSNGAAHNRSGPTDKSNADGSRAWVIDCASPANPLNTVTIGTLTVDSLGKGTGTYTLPTTGVASGPNDEAAVCVSDMFGNNGNQAPVTIL